MKATVLCVLVGCTPVDSNAVTTANLNLQVEVQANGIGGSQVFAWLFSHRDGDPPLNLETIRLVGEDSLTATTNGHAVAMQESDLVVEYRYDAAFDTAEAGQSYEVALDRVADTSAPHSVVTLPAPFTLAMPATASRSAPLTITWSPSGSSDPIAIAIGGCASAQLGPIADSGTATFPAGTVTADQPGATCDATVDISRKRTGTLDRAYGQGGSIVAAQRRHATITTTP